jgi:hypothetical protein
MGLLARVFYALYLAVHHVVHIKAILTEHICSITGSNLIPARILTRLQMTIMFALALHGIILLL